MYLKDSKTVVIKIGSSLLINDKKIIREKWLSEFAKDILHLQKLKKNIILVSSGAIALGCKKLKLSNNEKFYKLLFKFGYFLSKKPLDRIKILKSFQNSSGYMKKLSKLRRMCGKVVKYHR